MRSLTPKRQAIPKMLSPIDLKFPFPDGIPGAALKYAGSKILAHQATRDWLKANKPSYLLNTLHASFVLGNDLNQKNAEALSGINRLFWGSLFSEQPLFANAWVHVLDVAATHIKVIKTDTVQGARIRPLQP